MSTWVLGITGGIGSGKSTVASRFAELGIHRVDADQAARWVVEPGQPGGAMAPPAALQLTLQLEDWGEMRRLYALPPL